MDEDEIEWVREGMLARSCRPRYWDDRTLEVGVREWIARVTAMGVRSIICLLTERELSKYYGQHGIDLLQRYREAGFDVGHIPVIDHLKPPVTEAQLQSLGEELRQRPAPWLIHCSAGIDRTGSAVNYLKAHA